ncbi:MAG TPA: hypothetical protein VFS39_13240 [Nitrospira sp.]|nr:hypothetical protein [Nitrospira sp.]
MRRSISRTVLLLLAVWLLTGGLALADSFGTAGIAQSPLQDNNQALETELDELRGAADGVAVPVGRLSPGGDRCSTLIGILFDTPPQAAGRPLHEVLRIFRI